MLYSFSLSKIISSLHNVNSHFLSCSYWWRSLVHIWWCRKIHLTTKTKQPSLIVIVNPAASQVFSFQFIRLSLSLPFSAILKVTSQWGDTVSEMACYNVMGRIKLVRRMRNAVWTSSRFLFCYRLLLSAWLKMLNLFIPLRWLQCFRGVCRRVLPLPSLSFHRSPVYTLVCVCATERGFVF